jgi:uncharacterized protein with FMN-binding domain
VAAIYAIGYGATQPARIPVKPTNAMHTIAPHLPAGGGPVAAPRYKDGGFTGTGASQYGDLSVEVTVRRGRVASVEVTRATTFFPADAVSPLIPEVIARQSAQLDVVSGATGSSQAFREAVQHALGKARV